MSSWLKYVQLMRIQTLDWLDSPPHNWSGEFHEISVPLGLAPAEQIVRPEGRTALSQRYRMRCTRDLRSILLRTSGLSELCSNMIKLKMTHLDLLLWETCVVNKTSFVYCTVCVRVAEAHRTQEHERNEHEVTDHLYRGTASHVDLLPLRAPMNGHNMINFSRCDSFFSPLCSMNLTKVHKEK